MGMWLYFQWRGDLHIKLLPSLLQIAVYKLLIQRLYGETPGTGVDVLFLLLGIMSGDILYMMKTVAV